MTEPTIDECFAAGKGPEQSVTYSEGGLSNTPEERARFEAYMRGHCWEIGNYDESLNAYDTVLVRMLYGVWRDRGALCESKRKSLDAQAVPVEPEWVIQSRKSKKLGFSGDYSHLDYIDTLQSARKLAHTERENWQETARQYAGNSDYWRERAEKAEALAEQFRKDADGRMQYLYKNAMLPLLKPHFTYDQWLAAIDSARAG